nr:PREDICTED: aminopeptidase N-like isoform X2 [Bemisia tabaci]
MESKMCGPFFLVLTLLIRFSAPAFVPEIPLVKSANPNVQKNSNMTIYRLPKNVEPLEYTLKLNTDLTDFTFKGNEELRITVIVPTSNIVLNSRGLEISKVTVKNQKGFDIFSNFTMDPDNEQMSIYCPELTMKRQYTVIIDFSGKLSDDMHGYYRSWYTVKDTKKWLAITQFESTYARRAFPCFDEPGFKTPYTIHLAVSQGQTALSNMPEESRSNPDASIGNKVWVRFRKSEPMPTYLVAFSVSEMKVYSKDNQRVRVWSREDAVDDTHYIQEVGERLLTALEQYLNVKYKLPKLDIVAVPDFSAGAMENYGLTTYREKYVLKTALATERNTEFIVSVVAHEFSHQWFGDMLTPYWWDFTWLNEAFATFFEYRTPDMVESNWRMGDIFVVEQVHTALMADFHTHPITASVQSPEEISEIFDSITYNKGGAVLRMLEHFITPAAFQATLTTYLDSTYTDGGVTDAGTFFDSVTDTMNTVTNQNWQSKISAFKSSWIDQSGYPVVTVTRDYDKKTATVTQEPFFLEKQETPSDKKWLIPLTYTTSNEKNFTLEEANRKMVLFNPTEKTANIDVQSARWLVVNVQEIGFYRVNYDEHNWKELITALQTNPSDIHVLNRAQLIDDAFNLARAGIIQYSVPMTLSKYLAKESDPVPFLAAFPNFRYLLTRFNGQLADAFKKHFASLVKSKYESLAAKSNKDHVEKTGLITMSQWACYLNVDSCVNKAKEEMSKLIQNPDYKIEPEIKESVLCTSLRLGGETEWNAVWNHYLKTNVATEKVLTLTSLPCSTYSKALETLVNEMITGQNIRTQDYVYTVRSIASQEHHILSALTMLRTNYANIISGVKKDELLKMFVKQLQNSIWNPTQLAELRKLALDENTEHSHAHMVNHTIEHVTKNLEWTEKNLASLQKWFKDEEDNPTPDNDSTTKNPDEPTKAPPSSATQPLATLIGCSLAFFVLYRRLESFPL